MDGVQDLIIQSEMDIITARMHVRGMAGALGMDLANQARISLAASSLAHALELGSMRQGRMTMDYVHEGERTAVRVICVTTDEAPQPLSEIRWMVDEMKIETLASGELQVTLVKWAA